MLNDTSRFIYILCFERRSFQMGGMYSMYLGIV